MSEKLCLQWNDFKENVVNTFGSLKEDEDFTDVTLACEDGKQVEAHKVILANSSPFFQNIEKEQKAHRFLSFLQNNFWPTFFVQIAHFCTGTIFE